MYWHPFNYEQLNIAGGMYHPSCVKSFDNLAAAFWERSLFQRAASVLEFDLPESWNGSIYDLFIYCLFGRGYLIVFDDKEKGKVFQPGSLGGIDFWYRPTYAIVANPAIGSRKFEIGDAKVEGVEDGKCELLKLTPDYQGIFDIIEMYAEKLALLDSAINMSLINNKFAYLLAAKNKQAAEALKKIIDKINSGEPAVIFDQRIQNDPNDKSIPWHFLERGNLKESYLTDMQLKDFRTIIHDFDTEIGIPTLGVGEKKERMITDEANAMKRDSMGRSDVWIQTFNESAVAVNKRFGLNISVSRKEIQTDGEAYSAGNV